MVPLPPGNAQRDGGEKKAKAICLAARMPASEASLQHSLEAREQGRRDEVPDAPNDEQWNRLESSSIDSLNRVEQVGNGQNADERGCLQHANDLVPRWWDNDPQRLWKDDPPDRTRRCHAQRVGRFALTWVDGQQSAADDLCHVSALVQAETQQGRHKG